MNIWVIRKSLIKLPEKEKFYSDITKEDITEVHYKHGKTLKFVKTEFWVCKDFERKNLGECHDLYLRSEALLLADVFENFRKMCLNIHALGPVRFISVPGLA